MSNEAGWRNDPYGRFQLRYWDGEKWTEHVATGGEQQVDPMGASAVIPFATPASAFPAPGAGAGETTGGQLQGFAAPSAAAPPDGASPDGTPDGTPASSSRGLIGLLDRMGPDARERVRPGLRAALAGVGGFVLAVGILVAISGNSPSRGTFIVGGLVLTAAAWALRTFVKVPEAQAAAVGAVVVGIPSLAGGITLDGGSNSFLPSALTAVLFLAAWALPGFRGRTMLLGLGALFLLGAVGTVVSSSASEDECMGYLEAGDYDSYYSECEDALTGSNILPVEVTDNLGDQGVVWLGGAAVFLGLTWWLDRRGYKGTATGLCAAGLLGALIGTGLLTEKFGDTGGPVFVMLVGLLVCIVGSHGARRATTWWGAMLTATGVIAFVAIQMEPSSRGALGGALIAAGLVLVSIPLVAAPLRAALRDNAASTPPPPPPGGTA